MSGDILGLLALAIVVAAGVVWFRLIKAVRVPTDRRAYLLAMGLGAGLGVVSLMLPSGLAARVGAIFALIAGGVFVGLRLQSSQAQSAPAVSLGGPILDFTAPDDRGQPFELASLRGQPFLLKFFRGHW